MHASDGFLAKTLERSLFYFQNDQPGWPVQTFGKRPYILLTEVLRNTKNIPKLRLRAKNIFVFCIRFGIELYV